MKGSSDVNIVSFKLFLFVSLLVFNNVDFICKDQGKKYREIEHLPSSGLPD